MITGTTVSGAAAVLGFGAAALLLLQPYLVRRFPRIAGWLPEPGTAAETAPPLPVGGSARPAPEMLDGRLLALEAASNGQADRLAKLEEARDGALARFADIGERLAALTLQLEAIEGERSNIRASLAELQARSGGLEETAKRGAALATTLADILLAERQRRQLRIDERKLRRLSVQSRNRAVPEGKTEEEALSELGRDVISLALSLGAACGVYDPASRIASASSEVDFDIRNGKTPSAQRAWAEAEKRCEILLKLAEERDIELSLELRDFHDWFSRRGKDQAFQRRHGTGG